MTTIIRQRNGCNWGPVGQWTLDGACRDKYKAFPHNIDFGRDPGTLFAILAVLEEEYWTVDTLDMVRV